MMLLSFVALLIGTWSSPVLSSLPVGPKLHVRVPPGFKLDKTFLVPAEDDVAEEGDVAGPLRLRRRARSTPATFRAGVQTGASRPNDDDEEGAWPQRPAPEEVVMLSAGEGEDPRHADCSPPPPVYFRVRKGHGPTVRDRWLYRTAVATRGYRSNGCSMPPLFVLRFSSEDFPHFRNALPEIGFVRLLGLGDEGAEDKKNNITIVSVSGPAMARLCRTSRVRWIRIQDSGSEDLDFISAGREKLWDLDLIRGRVRGFLCAGRTRTHDSRGSGTMAILAAKFIFDLETGLEPARAEARANGDVLPGMEG